MSNVWLTPERAAATSVELTAEDADWLADQLDRITDPSDTPAAPDAASQLREATTDQGDHEPRLTDAELDAIRRVFEIAPDANGSTALRNLRDEIARWVG
jgi:hypothetical protein